MATNTENNVTDSRRNGILLRNRRVPPPPIGQAPQPAVVFPWILKLRCQSRTGSLGTIRIQINPSMTDVQLGQCITQAVASYNSMPPAEQIVVSGCFLNFHQVYDSIDSVRHVSKYKRPLTDCSTYLLCSFLEIKIK